MSNSTFPDDSAYPVAFDEYKATVVHGLTKREYFAAMALQALCSPLESDGRPEKWDFDMLAECATKAADALINKLNKEVSI